MLQGKCPKCRRDLTISIEKETMSCMYCGQEIAVKDAVSQVKQVDDSLMDEKEYNEELAEACQLLPAMLVFKDADKRFQKETYGDAFQEYYTIHYRTMMKVEKIFTASKKQELLITQMAEAFLDVAEKAIQTLPKNEQNKRQVHHNFMMATYVFPAMARYKGPAMDALTDCLAEQWGNRFKGSRVRKTSFEKINSGFCKRLCYITTAVCESLDKDDDCYELKTLRNYRDGYLMKSAEGSRLIQEYYDVAPTIVKHINKKVEARVIYQEICERYLSPCIKKIEQNDLIGCKLIYEEMVYALKEQYMIEKEKCANE